MIKKSSLLIYIIASSLACITTLTNASPSNWKPIVSAGLGVAMGYDVGKNQNFPIQNPATDEFYNYSANSTTQSALLTEMFVGFEKQFAPTWAVQLGIDYAQASSFLAQGTLYQGVDASSADTYHYQYTIASRQLSIESKLLYTYKTIYHPYALIGLGAAFNRAQSYSTSASPFLTFTRTYADNTTTSFSPTVGFGIDTDVSPTCRVGLGYRFTDLGKVETGAATIDGTGVSGTLSQSHLYSSEVLAQISWLF